LRLRRIAGERTPGAWRLIPILLLALALPATASSAAPPARGAAGDPVRVVVALLPFQVHSARPLAYLETSLADLLASRLEASGRVQVLESVTVRESLIAYGGERTEDAVRRLARELGADYVVVGSLTELAGRYSLDVRVTPVESFVATSTMVFTAEGDDELLDRVNELATRVLEIVGDTAARSRVVEVRIEGVPGVAEAARRELRMRSGSRYESADVRADLETLRALPGVATATAETERRHEGIAVVYRLVPTERIMPAGEVAPSADRVADVQVRGNRRIEANAILARVSTKAGEPFSALRLAHDVRDVYGLGFFRNVRVLSEDSIDGRILIFEVEENPVVRQVSITGNDSLSGDKIRDNLTLTTGSTLDLPLIFENRERIEALYRAEGYYLARVRHKIEELPGDAVAIDFEVSEGKKLRLRAIEFQGNEHFSDDELRSSLKTKRWRWYSHATRFLDRSGTYSEPIFLQDLQTISNRYLDHGFIKIDIAEPDVQPDQDGLIVRVRITEGERYRVGSVDVAGDDTVDLDDLRERLRLKEGDFFSRASLSRDREALERRYTDRGFFLAEVTPGTYVDDDDLRVDLVFEVVKGPLYFLREIDITGNTQTIDPVIRREIQTVEGQLYSQRELDLSEARVRGLGFFEQVNFEPRQTDYADQLDLDVKVVERPTGSLSFGGGFSSQDGLVVTGSVSQTNLFGRGYGGQLSADVGRRTQRFFLNFSNPYLLGTTWGFSTSIFATDLRFEDFTQETAGIDLVLSHSLDEANRSRGFLRYSYSQRRIRQPTGVNAAAVIFRELLMGSESTSLLGVSWRRDTLDDRIAPRRGSLLAASVEGAGLGGFAKFARFETRGSWFYPTPERFPDWFPFKDRSTWVFSARAGWAIPFNDIDDFELLVPDFDVPRDSEVQPLRNIDTEIRLPLTERYFLGGIGSYQLRGFKARSVGPRRPILRRTGLFGTGDLFTPVGRIVDESGSSICADFDLSLFFLDLQGDKDGKCNSIRDRRIKDFDDLDETDVIGGNKFLTFSSEYRFPISESMGLIGIVFLDVGNAFDETQNIWDVSEFRYGTGFGALWFSPFGPLQAFVGFPIDKLSVEDSVVFEFSVGGAGL
jgi:outer membrane protein insertion porin family